MREQEDLAAGRVLTVARFRLRVATLLNSYGIRAEWADLDGDGKVDLLITTASTLANQLYRNEGFHNVIVSVYSLGSDFLWSKRVFITPA